MAELSQAEFDAAILAGEREFHTQPRACTVRFDEASERIVIDLVNGATFAMPARLIQGLETAATAEIADVEILGVGLGLHWETLDVDVTLEGLMAGRFGTARYMAERFGAGWDAAAAE